MSTTTQLQQEFRNGHLRLQPGDYTKVAAVYGRPKRVRAEKTIAARLAKAHQPSGNGFKAPESQTVTVGTAPDGFGKYVAWSERDRQLGLVIYLNAADPTGVGILGVQATDTIELVGAVGHASFAQETENDGIPALIGIVAAGANLTAGVFGHPEVAPLIEAGAAFAEDRFKEQQVRTKLRDPYGRDPSSQHMARQEGGVLVCKPGAHGVYSSGEDERFWVKEPGNRIDANRPDHVKQAYFLRRGMGKEMSRDAGDLFVVAWDHVFADNLGFYELHVIVRRGSGKLPQPPVPTPVS